MHHFRVHTPSSIGSQIWAQANVVLNDSRFVTELLTPDANCLRASFLFIYFGFDFVLFVIVSCLFYVCISLSLSLSLSLSFTESVYIGIPLRWRACHTM